MKRRELERRARGLRAALAETEARIAALGYDDEETCAFCGSAPGTESAPADGRPMCVGCKEWVETFTGLFPPHKPPRRRRRRRLMFDDVEEFEPGPDPLECLVKVWDIERRRAGA